MINNPPKVCVVGAGIAGLTFAQVLIKRSVGIQPIIYERDASPSARSQGGTLDLKADGGQVALKLAGLFEEFQKVMRREGQEMKIMLPTGKILMHHADVDEEDFNPEIDRGQLRALFLNQLGSSIRWGAHVTGIEPIRNPEHSDSAVSKGFSAQMYRVILADGTSDDFDLVVGADGCFSRVRPLLSEVKPIYTGYTFTECYLSSVAQRYPRLNDLVGHGTLMVAATNGKAITAQQNGDGTLRVGAILEVSEDWHRTNGFPWEADPVTTRKLLLEHYLSGSSNSASTSPDTTPGWSSDLLDLIRLSDDTFRPWPLYALPVDHEWDHKQGLTLIGDAAHVMSPFAGEGANIAMLDGAKLAEAIADSVQVTPVSGGIYNVAQEKAQTLDHAGDPNRASAIVLVGLDDKVREFERGMFDRAHIAAAESNQNMHQFLGSEEDVEAIIAKWSEMMSGGPPEGH